MTLSKIKIVTDSVADVPADLAAKWNITVVPCFVNFGGKSYADDGKELVREDYYRQLITMSEIPTTSAMPPDFAREYIDKAFENADHLIIITTPAKLSGIYNSMRLGSSHLPPERVTLIDSGQLSIGIGWQVLHAAQIAAETGDLSRTIQAIKQTQQYQHVYALISDIHFLRRSGRVGWAAAGIGTLLQIKPVVQVKDSVVEPVARIRTMNRAVEKLVELTRANVPIDKLAILHTINPEGLSALQSQLKDILPEGAVIGTICPALGTHIGPGALGIATVSKGWKDAISPGNAG